MPNSGHIMCPRCRAENYATDDVCLQCGAALHSLATPPPPMQRRTRDTLVSKLEMTPAEVLKKGAAIIVLLGLLIAIIYMQVTPVAPPGYDTINTRSGAHTIYVTHKDRLRNRDANCFFCGIGCFILILYVFDVSLAVFRRRDGADV